MFRVGNFLLVDPQTPPSPPNVYKSPIPNLVLSETFGGGPPPPLQKCKKSQYQCWWSFILLHNLSYTTDTILPLFLLITRGADNSRTDYTAPSWPTEQLSYSFISRVDFRTLSEGGPPPLRSVRKYYNKYWTFVQFGRGGSVGPLLGQSPEGDADFWENKSLAKKKAKHLFGQEFVWATYFCFAQETIFCHICWPQKIVWQNYF